LKRYAWIVVAALALLIVLAGCGSAENEKAYVWQQFDSEVRVDGDGGLHVSETLTLRFSGGPFTFAYRDLPQRRLDAISNIRVSAGEREFRQVDDTDSDEPFTFSVAEEGGARRIRWVYPPASDSAQTFVVSYDVAGAVRRYADHDQIWWSLVPASRDEPVESARGRIVFEQPVAAAELEASAPDVGGQVTSAAGSVTVQAASIPSGQELTLKVDFPKNIVGGAAPAWQAATEAQAAYDATTRPRVNVALSALAAVLGLFGAGALWLWSRRVRDPQGRGFAGAALPAQPDDLAPALAARLLRSPDSAALLATLLDLARRGYLTLHEVERASRFGQAKTLARRARRDTAELAEYERIALEAAFGDADEVELSKRQSALVKATGPLGRAAQRELIERGYLDAAALGRRGRALTASALLFGISVAGLGLAAILAERFSWWLPVVAGVLAALALIWLIASASLRGTTQLGADALLRWRAFQRYLRQIKPDANTQGAFEHLLGYATALGQQTRLIKAYSATSEPLPVWYVPAHGQGQASIGGAGQTLLLQDFSQNFTAALGSASASAGGGAAGGGGASGGGGAGAG
jgi:hypothetical protein